MSHRYFYYKARSTQGWMPVLDSNLPGKASDGTKAPRLLRDPVLLTAEQAHWDLDRCVKEWPVS